MDRNFRTTGIVVFALLFIVAIVYFVRKPNPNPNPNPTPIPPPPPPPLVKGDSPAEVVGGSIFLKWKPNYATQPPSGNVVHGTSDDTTKLDFDNLGGKTAITAASGWKIHISNRDMKGNEINDAIVVCSASDCSLSPGDGKTYYVKLRQGEMVDPNPPASNEMHFHDQQSCSGVHEDPRCDKAVHFKFEIGGVPTTDIEACNNDGGKNCTVFIGTR